MSSERTRPTVFVSYSREDAEWRRRFVEMLKPVADQRQFDVWSDDRNLIGEEWRPELANAIDRAVAALLLVSPPFLNSEFITKTEIPALRKRGVPLACVLVRDALWEENELLERIQWAHDPGAGSIAMAANQEGEIVRVCRKVLELLPVEPTREAREEPVVPAQATSQAVPLAAGGRVAELRGVPPLPLGFVERQELDGLRDAVLAPGDGAVGITGGAALGLHGQGGIGKTVLAIALARDEDVRRHFPDGVIWVTLGEQADLVAAQIDLLARLGAEGDRPRTASEGVARLREALADRQCLLIVDDVWSAAAAQAFRVAGARGRILYTTRDPSLLRGVHADVRRVDVLSEPAARELLGRLSGTDPAALPPETGRVTEATGRVALGIALVGAAVGGGASWAEVADQLDDGQRTFLDHPYANTFKAMQVGVAALDDDLAAAYRHLAVYPPDTEVPVAAVGRLWGHLRDASAAQTEKDLTELAARELLSLRAGHIAFHDLQRDFLLLQTADLSLLHADLLGAYRALLQPPGGEWRTLPAEEPYIWEHLFEHLRGAGEISTISKVAEDLGYLARRAFRHGPYAVEADLTLAAALEPEDRTIESLLRLFTQWPQLFTDEPSLGQMAITLAARATQPDLDLSSSDLLDLLPATRLEVRWGLPASPVSLARAMKGHDAARTVAFSPDGRRLASGGMDDALVCLWDVQSGQPFAKLEGHGGWLETVAFSPDGTQLATGGHDKAIRLWDSRGGEAIRAIPTENTVKNLWYSADGRELVSVEGSVHVRDAITGAISTTLIERSFGVYDPVAFSPAAGRVATVSLVDKEIEVRDTSSGALMATTPRAGNQVVTLVFSADGRQLASSGRERWICVWDAETGHEITRLEGATDDIASIAFARDGRVAAGDHGGNVWVWDPSDAAPIARLASHTSTVKEIAFSSDGRWLASASFDGTVRLWDPRTPEPASAPGGHTAPARAVAASPDGRQIASAGEDGTVRLWDAASGRPAETRRNEGVRIWSVTFSPDGCRLATGGEDHLARIWPLAGAEPEQVLEGHSDWVSAVAFSPADHRIATAGLDGTVRIWDPEDGRELELLTVDQTRAPQDPHLANLPTWVRDVRFSRDGRALAGACSDGVIYVWDPGDIDQPARLEGPDEELFGLAFAPDDRLASAGAAQTVRLWDLRSGREIAQLEGHGSWVLDVSFSPDGRHLASGGHDQTVRVWDSASGAEVAHLRLGMPVVSLDWGPLGLSIAAHTSVIQLELVEG